MSASGLVVVDKPAGLTSHDVVARVRRLAGTRKVGHAGTLDPMATGVLVVGVERATRLLGHLMLTDKAYDATVRLGVATTTDDAEGDVTASAATGHLDEATVRAALAAYVGDLQQVPTAVSAIKVDGKRAYARVRDGEDVQLAARPVRIHALDVHEVRRAGEGLDVDISVRCSSGTYIRAIARDAGADSLRTALVRHLTSLGTIRDRRIAAAFQAVPRHLFVPQVPLETAYADDIIPTRHTPDGRVCSSVSAPWLQAVMLEAARIRPGHHVLEIGSGGYNAALAAELTGPIRPRPRRDGGRRTPPARRRSLRGRGR